MSHQVEESNQVPPEILAEGYETRDVNIKVLWGWTAGITILVAISYVLLDGIYMQTIKEMRLEQEAVLTYESAAGSGPNAHKPPMARAQIEELNTTGVVDKDAGVYRISIDAAMAKVAAEDRKARQ